MEPKFALEYPMGIPRGKRPHGSQVPLRQVTGISAEDIEQEPMKYIALALVHMKMQLQNLAVMSADHSRPVDEYQSQTLVAETTNNSLELQPQYEVPELIECIIITGPTGAFTLQLGDRTWNLVMPATQCMTIGAPMRLLLSRNDRRVLTSAVTGEWTLELTGHADTRGNLI